MAVPVTDSAASCVTSTTYTAEEMARMDAEDRLLDEPGIDWEEIAATSEADRRAGRFISFEELDRRTFRDIEALERMTPEELDALLASERAFTSFISRSS